MPSWYSLQVEAAQGLLHSWVLEGAGLVGDELIGTLCDPEGQGLLPKPEILRGDC